VRERHHEASPPQIFASGRGRCRSPCRIAVRIGASLSGAAGAHSRRFSGSAPDIVARLLGQQLSDRLGQPFVIDNRPGASSNIATEAVVHAAPDGYTLLVVSLANVFNATLYDKLNFDFIRDIAPIASIDRQPFVLETHPSVPARTVPEFIAYARSNPSKLNMASSGTCAVPHIAGELFKMMAGIDMVHVPYRGGGPAVTDLIAGQVQVYFATIVSPRPLAGRRWVTLMRDSMKRSPQCAFNRSLNRRPSALSLAVAYASAKPDCARSRATSDSSRLIFSNRRPLMS
jgi:hypothetical protein